MALESLKLHLGVETPSPILNAFRNAGFDAIDYGDISLMMDKRIYSG